jgi:hypothetical protein
MERNHILIPGTGIIICAILFFYDIFPGAIGVVIPGAPAMSVFIMQESRDLPDITIRLREDAKSVVISNQGNAEGACYTRTYALSAPGRTEDDLLKPLFPIFRWK